ncbi:hypothetical protein AAFF_G00047150 [Aldrovandia affinis]|uniref:Uncharacterized protein n=1 Tax=Aldrovandia affinis TaxID=143900 RepID=A0AAD7S1R0_9TELE|nr:hypothetical protein AAFF_G00047150 [Aldrovandia affinis]
MKRVKPTAPEWSEPMHGSLHRKRGAGCFTVNVIQTGPNEYRDEYGNPVNAKAVRGGAGWECWNYHPLAAKLVKDPRFWAGYAGDSFDGEDWHQRDEEE